jgi:hypothetical protein
MNFWFRLEGSMYRRYMRGGVTVAVVFPSGNRWSAYSSHVLMPDRLYRTEKEAKAVVEAIFALKGAP